MKKIARIPLSEIDRIELRVTHCRKSLAQVKQVLGAVLERLRLCLGQGT